MKTIHQDTHNKFVSFFDKKITNTPNKRLLFAHYRAMLSGKSMRIRPTYIATFEAKPGMRLARPISKVFNHRLFQLLAGTELTEEQIRQIAIHGIHFLVVEEADPRTDAQLEQDRVAIENETRHIFSEANLSRPAIVGLYSVTLEYRLLHA